MRNPLEAFVDAKPALIHIDPRQIEPDPNQPRRDATEDLAPLTDSVRMLGVLEPLLVKRDPEGGGYRLVAGERRLRAAREAGLNTVPVLILPPDADVDAIQLAENLARRNLKPLERMLALVRLLERSTGMSREEMLARVRALYNAQRKGQQIKPLPEDAAIQETFRRAGYALTTFAQHDVPVARLPERAWNALLAGEISYGQARALARAREDELDELLAEARAGATPAELRRRLKELRGEADTPAARLARLAKRARRLHDSERAAELAALVERLEALLEEAR